MKIGVIGAGNIGTSFAKHVAKLGYDVIISSHADPISLGATLKSIGANAKAGTVADAVKADIIFLGVPFAAVKDAVSGHDWNNKTVIDATNAVTMPGLKPIDTGGKNSTEIVAGFMPGAKVVKAFNTLPAPLMASNPIKKDGGRRVLFYSGNDEHSKKVVAEIIEKIGFAGIDLGNLDKGGKLQELMIGNLSFKNLVLEPMQ